MRSDRSSLLCFHYYTYTVTELSFWYHNQVNQPNPTQPMRWALIHHHHHHYQDKNLPSISPGLSCSESEEALICFLLQSRSVVIIFFSISINLLHELMLLMLCQVIKNVHFNIFQCHFHAIEMCKPALALAHLSVRLCFLFSLFLCALSAPSPSQIAWFTLSNYLIADWLIPPLWIGPTNVEPFCCNVSPSASSLEEMRRKIVLFLSTFNFQLSLSEKAKLIIIIHASSFKF